MSFIETVQQARALLRQSGRISKRAFQREFDLEADALEDLVAELVDVQNVATREGESLAWVPLGNQLEAKQASAAERRQLTVLFCDLVDSTRLAAGLDPEDWRQVVRDYQQAATQVIERFAGHVAQYLGDGLLVYFGWPQAHEDDAERAVRAGLGLVETVSRSRALASERELDLSVRIGIHSGLVVVGEMGAGATRETLAMGDTTNVAARLEGIAEPDTVVLSATTLRLVAGIFMTRDLGDKVLKGLVKPVRVHRAERLSGMRSRLDVTAASDLTAFVGRGDELDLLDERWSQAQNGNGQTVLIAGEAGSGKSRLVREFRGRVAEHAHSWLECRCSPYMRDSALFPVLELQREAFGMSGDLPLDAQLERLERGLGHAGLELVEAMPLMTSFHSLPLPDRFAEPLLSAEGRRKRTIELLLEWLVFSSRVQALVLFIEDLHWIDPSTLQFIVSLMQAIPGERLLLIASHRADLGAPWAPGPHLTSMQLERLTHRQVVDLIRAAAHDRELPEEWLDQIVARSDGVPLFAEELIRAVLDSNAEERTGEETAELHIPESLQDSLMARLDALGPAKSIAQLGSVIGREFDFGLLLAVSSLPADDLDRTLQEAVRAKALYQRGRPPRASFLFRHALLRDAAYRSLLHSTRRELHRRVAEVLLEGSAAASGAPPELIAHHLTEAQSNEAAIGQWQIAGSSAAAHSAIREALQHYRRGLDLIPRLDAGPNRDRLELELQLGSSVAITTSEGWSGSDAEVSWGRASELASKVGSAKQRARSLWGIATLRTSRAETNHAVQASTELRRLGQEIHDATIEVGGLNMLANDYLISGRFEECVDVAREIESVEDGACDHPGSIALFGHAAGISGRAWAAMAAHHARLDSSGLDLAAESLSLARSVGHPLTLCFPLLSMSTIMMSANVSEAAVLSEELAELGEKQSFRIWGGVGRAIHCWTLLHEGSGEQELAEQAVAALTAAASTGNNASAPEFMGLIASCFRTTGRIREALQWCDLALDAWSGKQPYWNAELLRTKGELLLEQDPASREGGALLERALAHARNQRAARLETRALTSAVRYAPDPKMREAARSSLSLAVAGARQRDADVAAALEVIG